MQKYIQVAQFQFQLHPKNPTKNTSHYTKTGTGLIRPIQWRAERLGEVILGCFLTFNNHPF